GLCRARAVCPHAARTAPEERFALPDEEGKRNHAKNHKSDDWGTRRLYANTAWRGPHLHWLRLHAEGQIHFDVCVLLEARQRFDLRDDPASFLPAANFIGERDFLPVFRDQRK